MREREREGEKERAATDRRTESNFLVMKKIHQIFLILTLQSISQNWQRSCEQGRGSERERERERLTERFGKYSDSERVSWGKLGKRVTESQG